jgi:hypothetical protein
MSRPQPSSLHGHSGLLRTSSRHSIWQGTIDRRTVIGFRRRSWPSHRTRAVGFFGDHLKAHEFASATAFSSRGHAAALRDGHLSQDADRLASTRALPRGGRARHQVRRHRVPGAEVHLVGRLSSKRRMWKLGCVRGRRTPPAGDRRDAIERVNGIHSRARSMALRIRALASPAGNRSLKRLNPEACNRARANRSSAASFSTRRRTFRISCRSSGSVRSATSRPTTTLGAAPSHPRAVERGTPRSVAMVRQRASRRKSKVTRTLPHVEAAGTHSSQHGASSGCTRVMMVLNFFDELRRLVP